MSDAVLETKCLTKRYGGKTVVDAVDIRVRPGEVYGFLGPNGAGKTTVIKMILGLVAPSGGTVSLFGSAAASRVELRRRIGVVSETPSLYVDMTAEEYLHFFAGLYEVDAPAVRARVMLERFGLGDSAGKRLRTFSQGMQQRVNLARAFLHDPELLLLDDPVSGLDPRWIKELRDIIKEARQRGKSVFLSSHLLSVVETVCDRVGIISTGRLLAEQSVDAITGALGGGRMVLLEVAEMTERIERSLRGLSFVRELSGHGSRFRLRIDAENGEREKISRAVTEAGGTVLGVEIEKTSLEDAFLELTEGNVSLLAGP